MNRVTGILMVLAVCGMIAGCNKTSRKVYDDTPGQKQTSGIGKSIYETEVVDVDAIYDIKEPATASAAPAPAPAAPAPAATPAAAPAPTPGGPAPAAAPAPEPVVAVAAPVPAPDAAPAPAAAAPATSNEDAAIKQALKDFVAAVEKKDKKRFMELVSYDQEKDKQIVAAAYSSMTAFVELDNAMKAKFKEGIIPAVNKSLPKSEGASMSVDSPMLTSDMIETTTINLSGDKATVHAKELKETFEMAKENGAWKLMLVALMSKGAGGDSKQILVGVKALGIASKAAMNTLKAGKPEPEVAGAFMNGLMMAMMSSGGMKMPKKMPSGEDIEKMKKKLPKEVGQITPEMMKKLQKLAMEGKVDPSDVAQAAQIQAKMKSGQKPDATDLEFIASLKTKYKL